MPLPKHEDVNLSALSPSRTRRALSQPMLTAWWSSGTRIAATGSGAGGRLRADDDLQSFPRYSPDISSDRYSSVAVASQGGDWVISGGSDGQVFLWSMPDGRPLQEFREPGSTGFIDHVAVAPDRSWVAGAGRMTWVWNTGTGELIRRAGYAESCTGHRRCERRLADRSRRPVRRHSYLGVPGIHPEGSP